jgi:hypothetical protein
MGVKHFHPQGNKSFSPCYGATLNTHIHTQTTKHSRLGWLSRYSDLLRAGQSRDRIPVGAHPASYTIGIGSFPGVMWQGHGIYHPPPSSAKIKERVELYLYPPSGPVQACNGTTFLGDKRCSQTQHRDVGSMYYLISNQDMLGIQGT